MRGHDHEELDQQHRAKAEHGQRGDQHLLGQAAVAGRGDVLGAAGLIDLQRLAGNDGVAAVLDEGPSPVLDVVGSGGGTAMDADTRADMESRFGQDFSDVRVHTGTSADVSARSVNASAYTVGSDIVFRDGSYDPSSDAGKHTLAHELTHVLQQRNGPVDGTDTGRGVQVSDPSDRGEREAVATADQVMSTPAPSVQREVQTADAPIGHSPGAVTVQRQGPFAPELAPTTGTHPDPFGLSPGGGPGSPAPSPGTVQNQTPDGDIEDVPTTTAKGHYGPTPPSLDAPMPTATIPDPGPIPGWKQIVPGRVTEFGPFKYTEDPQERVIAGASHSSTVQTAWADYKRFLPQVERTWNNEAQGALNAITQEAKGNGDLEKSAARFGDAYNVMLKPGGGTVSDQVLNQKIENRSTISQIDTSAREHAGDAALSAEMKASTAPTPGTTTSSPARDALQKLNNARKASRLKAESAGTTATKVKGLTKELEGKKAGLEAVELKKQVDADEAKKSEMQSGMDIVKGVSPEIARLSGLIKEMSDEVNKVVAPVTKAVGSVEKIAAGDITEVGALLTTGLNFVRMGEIESLNSGIKQKLASIKEKEFQAAKDEYDGVAMQVAAEVAALKTVGGELENLFEAEKAAYDGLAKELEKAGAAKGEDGAQMQLVADALRALPSVKKMVRFLMTAKSKLPKTPEMGTREEQGHTLAIRGVPAPGAAGLYEVLGWIEGAQVAVDDHIGSWQNIEANLEKFVSGLGVK